MKSKKINDTAVENWKNGIPPRNSIFPDHKNPEVIFLKKNQRINGTEVETLKIDPQNRTP